MSRRLTIKDMQIRAHAKGGLCLSEVYVNAGTPLTWQCKHGHTWDQRPHDIATGRWCPKCAIETRKNSLAEFKSLAEHRGGKCLSEQYINKRTKLSWQCSCGHVWETLPSTIRRGSWCPLCARKSKKRSKPRKHKLSLLDIQAIAKKYGGECISKDYSGMNVKHEWRCAKGHTWHSAPQNVEKGAWCPVCKLEVLSEKGLAKMQRIAVKHGGKCLSTTYKNTSQLLKWQCSKGHVWQATADNVDYGDTWCPYCAGKHNWSLEKMHEYASFHGGRCLSTKYVSGKHPIEWECKDGHTWRRSPGSMITQGQWCPHCFVYISEEICRKYFESLLRVPFPKVRPEWLISPKGRRMELDGFNSDLQIAFEHHGKQHYSTGRYSHSEEKLFLRKRYDEIKRRICSGRNILLIEIPELDRLLPITELRAFIKKHLVEAGKILPDDFDVLKIDLDGIRTVGKLDQLNEVAKSRGGKCLSSSWLGSKRKHRFQCSKGHQWEAQAYEVINQGTWCLECSKSARAQKAIKKDSDKKYLRLLQAVKARGGKCLTRSWFGAQKYHEFQCSQGHTWKAWPSNIIKGSWCPTCAKMRHKNLPRNPAD